MGYRLDRRYVLRWDGTDLDGAEVVIRATPIEVALEMLEDMEWPRLVVLLTQYVVRWNFEHEVDGEWVTVPIEADAINAHLEQPLVRAIRREWARAAMGITAPLGEKSDDGEPSPTEEPAELSIPMEAL